MDPVEKILVSKYGLSPEQARAYANRIRQGTDAESMAVKTEAFKPVVDDQERRLKRLSYYVDVSNRQAKGDKLSPRELAYIKQVNNQIEAERRQRFQRESAQQVAAQRRPVEAEAMNEDEIMAGFMRATGNVMARGGGGGGGGGGQMTPTPDPSAPIFESLPADFGQNIDWSKLPSGATGFTHPLDDITRATGFRNSDATKHWILTPPPPKPRTIYVPAYMGGPLVKKSY